MIRFLLSLSFIVLFIAIGFTQKPDQKPSVVGVVLDGSSNPIPYAAIALYSLDSVLVTGSTSDETGKFSISAKPGSYYLKITFLSFDDKFVSGINYTGDKPYFAGKIILSASSKNLDEFEVVAEQSHMELHLDKRVFVVGKDLSNTGSNAAEVLENVPSVGVDTEGNVSLRGSQNVRILIDGKPSGLVGIGNSNGLRQIQGNMIESVEVITNPSSRFDAEGEVGIINIKLKKEKMQGLNGSFEITTGVPHNHGVSFNLNYRKSRINFFAGGGVNFRKNLGNGYSWQEFYGDSLIFYERLREHSRGGLNGNVRAGADFYFTDKSILTVSGLYKQSFGENTAQLTYNDYNSADVLIQEVIRTEVENESQQNIEGNINYRKEFEQKGRQWNTDFKYMVSLDNEGADITEQNYTYDNQLNQRTANTENEQNILFQSDYIHPFSKKSKFETGVKATLRSINNDYIVEEKQSDNSWTPLSLYDNEFVYTENIYAGYLMGATELGDLSVQAGVRAEFADITTQLVKTNYINPRKYLNFFPSVFFSYKADSLNTLQLNYSRRLSRPGFRQLIPFFSYGDNRNFMSGNPDLDPEYTHSFEAGHLRYFTKGTLLSSVYYRYRTGVIERLTLPDEYGFIRFMPINLSTQHAYGLEFSLNYALQKWWKFTGNFNFYRAISKGEYNGQQLGSDTYTWSSRLTSKMTLMKKLDFQLSGNYQAPKLTTQGRTLAMYSFDAGFSKDVLKNNGTVSLSVKDVLNSRKRRSITETDAFYSESEFQWMSRAIVLSFSYRLNQKKQMGRGKRPDGMDGGGFEGGGDF